MDRFFDFLINHYVLTASFFTLAVLFVLNEIARGGKGVSPQGLSQLVNRENALIVDIRDANEFRNGHISGSQNIPYARIDEHIPPLKKDLARPIVVVCNIGQTAGSAGLKFKQAGFTKVYKLEGGISGWKAQSLPVVKKS